MHYFYLFLLAMLGGAFGASIYLVIHALIRRKRKNTTHILTKKHVIESLKHLKSS